MYFKEILRYIQIYTNLLLIKRGEYFYNTQICVNFLRVGNSKNIYFVNWNQLNQQQLKLSWVSFVRNRSL